MISYEGGKILSTYQDAKKLLRGEMVIPRFISCWLTHVCNLNCDYCLYASKHNQVKAFADPEKFKKFIDQIAEAGVEGLEFAGGGESALHPQCFEFAEYAHSKGMRVGMITNGTKFDFQRTIDHFVWIRIGIDAHFDELYQKVKGVPSGVFDLVVRNAKELIKVRDGKKSPAIGMKFLLGMKNYSYVREMAHFAKECGVDYAHFKAEHNSPDEMDELTRRDVQEELLDLKDELNGFVMESSAKLEATTGCFMAPTHSVMDAYGHFFVCCYFNDPEKDSFGNVFEKGFKEVWFSKEHWDKQNSYSIPECNKFDCRWHSYNTKMKEVLVDHKPDFAFV